MDSAFITIASVAFYAAGGWIVGELHNAVQKFNGDRIAKAQVFQSLVASFFGARMAYYAIVEWAKYPAMAGYVAAFFSAYLGSRLMQAIGDSIIDWIKAFISRFGVKQGS